MQKRRYPPAVAQPFLAGIAFLSLATFLPSFPQALGAIIRTAGAGSCYGYLKIEEQRRRIEDGEEALDEIDIALAELRIREQKLEQQKAEILAMVEAKMRDADSLVRSKLAEIEQEWEAIEGQKQELNQIGAELATKRQLLETEWNQWQLDKELAERELNLALFDKRREVEVGAANLQAREQEFEVITRTKQLEMQAQIARERQKVLDEQSALIQELLTEQEKIQVDKQALEDRYNALFLELEAARSEAINDQTVAQQQIDEMVAEKEAVLEQLRVKIFEEVDAEKQAYLEQVQGYIDHMQMQVDNLNAQLEELTETPAFGSEQGWAGYVGNQILDVIREFDLRVYPHECRQLPWSTQQNPAIVIWLKLGEKTRAEAVFNCKATIEGKVHYRPIEMQFDTRGFVAVAIGDTRGAIQLPAAPVGAEGEKKITERTPVQITEPTEQQRHDALANSSMFAVFGPTGIGKSTYVNNLLSYSQAHFGKNVEIQINDLKFPDPQTRWEILGKEVMPQYCDFEAGECLTGLQDMAATFLARKRKRLDEVRNKRPISSFKKSMWIVDEAPTLIDAYKQQGAAGYIKMAVRVARGLDGKICIIGQTPRCSDYGFKVPDMANFTRFWLGADFATIALREKQVTIAPDRKNRLLAEIYARQKLAAEQIDKGEVLPNGKPPAMYFALVATQSSEVFLMTLPPPNAYAGLEVVADDDNAPVTPDSEIPPVSKTELMRLLEEAKEAEGLLESSAPSMPDIEQPALSIDFSGLSPLQGAIATYCQQKRGQEFNPSEIYANSREVQQCVLVALRGKSAKQRKSPATVVRTACFELVKQGIGEMTKGAKTQKYVIR